MFGHDTGGRGLSIVVDNIAAEFPVLTTKSVAFKAIVAELLWMLGGSSSVKPLQEQGVTIWNEWADANGELGPVYGAQWRNWEGKFDQIGSLLKDIQKVRSNPNASEARRLILSSWNVARIAEMKLPPCHAFSQWHVRESDEFGGDRLDCSMYMRSCDAFLGLPFNIPQYALLTMLLAHVSELQPGSLTIHFGNLHVYTNHLEALETQWAREGRPGPRVQIVGPIDPTLRSVRRDSISLVGYNPHEKIHGEVAT